MRGLAGFRMTIAGYGKVMDVIYVYGVCIVKYLICHSERSEEDENASPTVHHDPA